MVKPEPQSNIVEICPGCSSLLYPHAGKYTFEELTIKKPLYIKKFFKSTDGTKEYMWIKVKKIEATGVTGKVNNVPNHPGVPKLNAVVHVDFVEIVTILYLP
jgi:hypothetical protein